MAGGGRGVWEVRGVWRDLASLDIMLFFSVSGHSLYFKDPRAVSCHWLLLAASCPDGSQASCSLLLATDLLLSGQVRVGYAGEPGEVVPLAPKEHVAVAQETCRPSA